MVQLSYLYMTTRKTKALTYRLNNNNYHYSVSVQSLSCVQLFETHGPQHARSPCPNRLILCCPLLRLPSIFSSTRVFSKESVLCIRWPKYWSCSFSISPANEYSEYLGWTGSISLLPKRLSRVSSNTTVQKHRFFSVQPSIWSNSHICT